MFEYYLIYRVIRYVRICSRSEGRVRGVELEAAGSGVLLGHVSQDSDVALLSPSSTPGVLHNPEVGARLGTVSDGEDSVIEGGSAESLEDSTVVELEAKAGGVDGNGDGSEGKGLLESGWALGGNIGEVADGGDSGDGGVASALSSLVGVGGLGVHGGLLSKGESVVHESTIAAHVALSLGAIDELLLREGGKVVSSDLVGTLHGSSGREGPA